MVVEDIRQRAAGDPDRLDEAGAGGRVPLDLDPLVGRKCRALREDLLRHGDLADVVERPRVAQRREAIRIPAEAERDRLGERRHTVPVSPHRVARLKRTRDLRQHRPDSFRAHRRFPSDQRQMPVIGLAVRDAPSSGNPSPVSIVRSNP